MKILYFAPIAYDGLKQRPQYIADYLAKEHEVWYIEPTVSIMKYVLKGGKTYKRLDYDINSNLHIVKLDGRFAAHISLQAFDFFGINTIYERKQIAELIRHCDIIWIGYCGWYDVIKNVQHKMIIYDKMDDDVSITQNKLLKKLLMRVEPLLIKRANLIFVTAKKFLDELLKQGKKVYHIPNAFDRSMNSNCIQKDLKDNNNRKVFGYVGMIAHWFDVSAIETILEADEKNIVVLVGPSQIPPIIHDRVIYTGTVPKEEVACYIQSFDVCLYPFKKSEFLDTIDPVKIYEYLAMNKPVIAVNSIETAKFDNLIYRYGDNRELSSILALKEWKAPFISENDYNLFFDNNTWEQRVNLIKDIIKNEVYNVG